WNIEKTAAVARAELKALQAQINPHFFFNTLNTISSLIPEDPDSAQRTLGMMADLSRYAFASAQNELVPLSRELDFARVYLAIEQLRFGSRLRVELPDIRRAEGIVLPPLILQPLIENAVKHGIAPRICGGAVCVRLDRDESAFSLTVENEGAAPRDDFF